MIFGVSGLSQDVFAAGFDTPIPLDSAGTVGVHTSTAIGTTDGFPVISYWDFTNDNLKFVHCTAADCSSIDTPIALDSAGSVGSHTSIAIGTDDFPVISYWDGTNDNLKFVHCTAADCSSIDTPIALDSAGSVGFYTSTAIGTDGFPVISYWDGTNDNLKFVHCTAADCSSIDTPIALDSAGSVGLYTSIAIGTDGFPVISYWDGTNDNLKFVHCTAADCSSIDTPIALDSAGLVGRYTSIAIGTDGFPVISYWDLTNDNLKFVHCTAADCSSIDTPIALDSAGNVGRYTSIAIGTDDFPVISYWDLTNDNLKFVHCTAADCSSIDTPIALDSAGSVGLYTSIAIGTDDFPVISYWDDTNDNLKFVHCTDVDCEIDSVPPTPTISSTESNPTNSNPVTYSVSFDEAINPATFATVDISASSGTVQSITNTDGGTNQAFSFEVATPSDGATLAVSIPAGGIDDVAGNANLVSNTVNRDIDYTSPTPTISSTESDPTNSDPVTYSVSFDEAINPATFGTVDISASSGTVQSITNTDAGVNQAFSFEVATPNDGATLAVSIPAGGIDDVAGNANLVSNTVNRDIDYTSPETTIDSAVDGNGISIFTELPPTTPSNSITFGFMGTDASGIASFECDLDSANIWSACTSTTTLGTLADGSHTFEVRAIDNAGNTDASPADFSWTIQTPGEATNELIQDIKDEGFAKNVEKSLLGPLKKVSKILGDNNLDNDQAACDKLTELLDNLAAKTDKIDDSDVVDALEADANAIKDAIGCPIV